MKKKTLRHGDKGELVKELQSILKSVGTFNGAIRGNFLALTEEAVEEFQMSHQDPKTGKPLEVDGVVGPATWRALEKPSGKGQKSGLGDKHAKLSAKMKIPEGLGDSRIKVLQTASKLYDQDIREIPDGSNRGDGVSAIIKGFGPAPWCALFVSHVWKLALGTFPMGKRHAHCVTMMKVAKKRGLWRKKDNYSPAPGDIFIMVTNRKKAQGHTGIVTHVDASGKKMNTLEGNFGNRLKRGTRELKQSSLEGFIVLHDDKGKVKFKTGLIQKMSTSGTTR